MINIRLDNNQLICRYYSNYKDNVYQQFEYKSTNGEYKKLYKTKLHIWK